MKNVLILTYEFPTKPGGIGRYLFNVAEAISKFDQFNVVLLTPVGQKMQCGEAEVIDKLGRGKLRDLFSIFKFIWQYRSGVIIWGHSRTFIFAYFFLLIGLNRFYKSLVPVHGSELTSTKRPVCKYFNKVLLKCGKIANNKFTQGLLPGNLQNKSVIVYPPINEIWFNKKATKKKNISNPRVFGTLSRLVKRKGHSQVIDCLNQLKADYDFKYIIAGEGTEKLNLTEKIKRYGLKEKVKLIGQLTEDQLFEFYDGIDIFIMLNSIEPNDVEGFGYSFVEAGARSVASIGGNNGGAREVIINGKTGYLVDVNNAGDVLATLKNVFKKPNLWVDLGQNAKMTYQSSFGSDKLMEVYYEVIRDL